MRRKCSVKGPRKRYVRGSPFMISTRPNLAGGFDMIVDTPHTKITIVCEGDYWIQIIARGLWKVILERRRELASQETALRGGDQ